MKFNDIIDLVQKLTDLNKNFGITFDITLQLLPSDMWIAELLTDNDENKKIINDLVQEEQKISDNEKALLSSEILTTNYEFTEFDDMSYVFTGNKIQLHSDIFYIPIIKIVMCY